MKAYLIHKLDVLRGKGQRGVLTENDFFYVRDGWELACREYSEYVDRPIQFNKNPNKARAFCPRDACSFACNVRYAVYAVMDEIGIERKVVG